jgi:predicted 3-demethylubiquinone-9 3-methyltransferase (glyoxalase superfamily)
VGSIMTVDFEIANAKVMGLNGGPLFKFSPSFSFFVSCDSPEEIKSLWSKLSTDGTTRLALDKYPWADMYGWTSDKFGVEWQLILAPNTEKIAPSFLFTDSLYGKGQEAIDFYTGILPNSKIESNMKDPNTGTIMHCAFSLNGQSFKLMEGAGKHGHSFNESMSLVVSCNSQIEIDTYWDRLTADGGKPVQCGWLKDKFGVSWQIVPSNIEKYASDPVQFEKAMAVIMKMVKLDMAAIDRAVNT